MDDLFIVLNGLNLIIVIILSMLSKFASNYSSHFKYIFRNDNITNTYRLIMYDELLFPALIERNEIADAVEMIATCEHLFTDTMKTICTNLISLTEQPGNAVNIREEVVIPVFEEYNVQNSICNIVSEAKDDFVFEEYIITLRNHNARIKYLEKTDIISIIFGNTKIDMEVTMNVMMVLIVLVTLPLLDMIRRHVFLHMNACISLDVLKIVIMIILPSSNVV